MNCPQVRSVIDVYVDGELDPLRDREIERHLQDCAMCSQAYKSHQALRTAIKEQGLYFTAPSSLQSRIRSSLPRPRHAESILRSTTWRWVGIAASLAAVAILTWRLTPPLQGPSTDELLIREISANHVRSLMVSHLVDIPSSDRHVVKPWFAGKLDFAPSVPDLAEQGFPLIGGRLDYLEHRVVAAVVYKRREHIINLFIWPGPLAATEETPPLAREGFRHIRWSESQMVYWAVSDLNSSELKQFVQLVQHQSSH